MRIIKTQYKDKKFLIVALVVIMALLCILLCFLHIFKTIRGNKRNEIRDIDTSLIESDTKSYSVEEILNSYGCKNIVHKTYRNSDGTRGNKITLQFKYNLFEGEESKEEYFNKIVNALKKVLENPFELIDEKKSIDIYFDKENHIYTINGVQDFYENSEYIKVNTHQELNIKRGSKESVIVNLLEIADWDRTKLVLEDEPKEITKEYIDYGGYKLYYYDKIIYNVVFESDYDKDVFESIKVGESLNRVEDKLGNPTFKYDDKIYGYKTETGYVFFYNDKIVVYPLSFRFQSDNYILESKLLEFYNGESDKEQAIFLNEFLRDYKDFSSEVTKDGVKVSSYLRGLEFTIKDNGEIEFKVYDNYRIGEKLKKLAEGGKVILSYDEDSIYIHERDRKY